MLTMSDPRSVPVRGFEPAGSPRRDRVADLAVARGLQLLGAVAIFEANPQAFEGNINRLKAGALMELAAVLGEPLLPVLRRLQGITRDRRLVERFVRLIRERLVAVPYREWVELRDQYLTPTP